MKSTGRWMLVVGPEASALEAAETILTARFADVVRAANRLVPKKLKSDASDSDRIHALRVATRRADAALGAFAPLLKRKHARRLLDQLASIRRAAGKVRDWDVIASQLRPESGTGARKPAQARLLAEIESRRATYAARLVGECSSKRIHAIEKHTLRMVESIQNHRDDGTFVEFARTLVANPLDQVSTAAAADLRDIEVLHELRLAIKRARYAIELIGACLSAHARKRLTAAFVPLQTNLGEINDAYIRGRLVSKLKSPGARAIEREANALCKRLHAAFIADWNAHAHTQFIQTIRGELISLLPATVPEPLSTPPSFDRAPTVVVEAKPPAAQRNGKHFSESSRTGARRVAAIDIGTNSTRLIIAESGEDGSYRVLDDEKELTRLGRGLSQSGRLDPSAIEHAIATVARMKAIAHGYGVEQLRVVATSAAREAENGEAFVQQLHQRTGLTVSIISGEQEAMLAYRSAARAFDLASAPSMVVDIGGGSTELVLAVPGSANAASNPSGVIERVYSLPLGAVRLTEMFGGPRESSGARYAQMCAHIRDTLKSAVARTDTPPSLIVGTGGTFTTLAAVLRQRELGDAVGSGGQGLFSGVQGFDASRADLRHVQERLRKLSLKERSRVPGLPSDRADIIVAGLAIAEGVLKRFDANRVRVHEGGIRDGLVLDMLSQGDGSIKALDVLAGVRRFARACAYEAAHSEHVCRLALSIFDQIADSGVSLKVGRLEHRDRVILEAASVLHDIGYLINYAQHHKHSYHLIVHADLPGLSIREVQVVANIARYHRASEPKPNHQAFASLSREDRERVRVLSGILRVADGLDRTHTQAVSSVNAKMGKRGIQISVRSAEEPSVDMWGAERKSGLFEKVLGRELCFEWHREGGVDAGERAGTTPSFERGVRQRARK